MLARPIGLQYRSNPGMFALRGLRGLGGAAVGSYNPSPVYNVLNNQPGGQSIQNLASYLRTNVLKPALGGVDAAAGNYLDAATIQSQLEMAAQSYCVGTEYGGTNDPCAGNDNGTPAQASLIQSLVQEYVSQVNAQGNASTLLNPNNTQGYQYTAYTPSYSVTGSIISYGDNGSGGIITTPSASENLPVLASPNSGYTQQAIVTGSQPTPTANNVQSTYPGYTQSTSTTGSQPVSSSSQSTAVTGSQAASQTSNQNQASTNPVATTTASSIDLSFLTNESLISGVPNWMIGVGVLLGLLIVPKMRGGNN